MNRTEVRSSCSMKHGSGPGPSRPDGAVQGLILRLSKETCLRALRLTPTAATILLLDGIICAWSSFPLPSTVPLSLSVSSLLLCLSALGPRPLGVVMGINF